MPATIRYLDRDGATQPPTTFDLGSAIAGHPQTPRKFAIQNIGDRAGGSSPFNGSELRRVAEGVNDGFGQFRIALDTETLSVPYGPVTATLGATADGGVWAGVANQFYRVTAVKGDGETPGSLEVVVLVDDVTKRVTLAWTEIPGATGYRVWRSLTSGAYGPTALVATIGSGAVTTYVDDGTAPGAGTIPTVNTTGGWALGATLGAAADGGIWGGTGPRFWRVVAIDEDGIPIAATLEVTLNVDDITKRVTLSWDAVDAAAGYLVYRSDDSEIYAAALRATLGEVTTYVDNGAATGAGDYTAGPSYGIPPALGLGPLNIGTLPRGKQVFFWVDRVIDAATPEIGNDRKAFTKYVELT
jgi:hypothetical protein